MTIVSVTPDIALDIGHTYAGGLGILEGDKFYAAAKLGLDYVVLSLYYGSGYVHYRFNEKDEPVSEPQPQPAELIKGLVAAEKLTVTLRGEKVAVQPLEYRLGTARVVFMQPLSPDWTVDLTDRLYVEKGLEEKFYKYLLLAKAAAEYIRKIIGVENIEYIDLQEAYTAILLFALRIPGKFRLVIHTPGPWGHPAFPKSFYEREFGFKFVEDSMVLTTLGLSCASEGFTVSAKHYDITSKVFPHFMDKVKYVTNGINIDRWMDPELRRLYETGELDLENFIDGRGRLRKELLAFIGAHKSVSADRRMIIVWARRMVPYKRPDFLIKFIEENPSFPAVYIVAGKAHPFDGIGLQYMRKFRDLSKKYQNVIYIPNYDLAIARVMLSGADLLLFTPFPGWEACGTSFMKAGVNGVPTLASRDGATIEFMVDGVNGWLFGTDLRELWNMDDQKSVELNGEEYGEFNGKLYQILNVHDADPKFFYRIGLNALRTYVPRVDIVRVLKEYYPGLIKT